jgi:hypothetical protein
MKKVFHWIFPGYDAPKNKRIDQVLLIALWLSLWCVIFSGFFNRQYPIEAGFFWKICIVIQVLTLLRIIYRYWKGQL